MEKYKKPNASIIKQLPEKTCVHQQLYTILTCLILHSTFETFVFFELANIFVLCMLILVDVSSRSDGSENIDFFIK